MDQSIVSLPEGRVDFSSFSLLVPELKLTNSFYWLRGPNGSGKTTLMRVILGLQALSSQSQVLETDQNFGYVPQQYRDALFPWLSAHENLNLFKVDDQFKLRWSEILGLKKNELKRRAYQLSGGQAQRLALIRECSLKPKLLVLDEPFSALDIHTRANAGTMIAEILDAGVQVIVATHTDLPEALTSKDYIEIDVVRETDEIARVSLA